MKRLSDIGVLASAVAHELRNSLAVIQVAAYNIRQKNKNRLIDKHLTVIEEEIAESNRVIKGLLAYSCIRKLDLRKVLIYDVLQESITWAKMRYRQKKITLKENLKLIKGVWLEIDPGQMTEVFQGVLNNAYQSFFEKRGKILIFAKRNKGCVVICFQDEGVGIEPKYLKKVFEPFFTKKPSGIGLGLSICREVVRLHQGQIKIKSKKGAGTTVTITLPLKKAE